MKIRKNVEHVIINKIKFKAKGTQKYFEMMFFNKNEKSPDLKNKLGDFNKYQYVKLSPRRYFCLQQSIFELAWVLFIKRETLSPGFRDKSANALMWIKKWLKFSYKYYKNNLKVLVSFILFKVNLCKYSSKLHLPFYGQLCMLVHKGYKIFDLKRGKVIKLFDNNVSKSIVFVEIELIKKISQIEFAPNIKKWNTEERWYEEDYIDGSLDAGKPLEPKLLVKTFFNNIAPCIERLFFFQAPFARNLLEYTNEITKNLSTTKWSINDLGSFKTSKIIDFIYSVINRLEKEKDCYLYLVFAHGDFCPENMIYTNQGLRIFDWEGAKYRSGLFDFYSYFFYGSALWGIAPEEQALEVKKVLPFIISKVTAKAPAIGQNLLDFEDVYRLIYYVERIYMLLERKKTDANVNIAKHILQYINAYNKYEELENDAKKIGCK